MTFQRLMSRPAVIAGLTISLLAATPSYAADPDYPAILVSADGLYDMVAAPDMTPSLVIVDVRPRAAYDDSHIPGAVHLAADDLIDPNTPVEGDLWSEEVLVNLIRTRGIWADDHVVIYDDRGGFHAARLFWLLEYFGHRHVSILDGGFPAWQAAGHDTSTVNPFVYPSDFSPSLSPRRMASADWLLEHRNDDGLVVIDVRGADAYAAGHIPWAANIPWVENLDDDDTMRPLDDLRAHFAAHGVTPDSNIAVHCQNGKAAAHSYFVLRLLGFPQVRVYDRSWAEWGSAGDLPVAAGS